MNTANPEQRLRRLIPTDQRLERKNGCGYPFERDYIGNTVNCRFTVPSYKDKRKMKRDPSEHIRFEHTHEPIIDMQTWETVQKLRQVNADRQA